MSLVEVSEEEMGLASAAVEVGANGSLQYVDQAGALPPESIGLDVLTRHLIQGEFRAVARLEGISWYPDGIPPQS